LQNSYELVKAAIHFDRPSRLPVRFEQFGCSDVVMLPDAVSVPWAEDFNGTDEWGCAWTRTGIGTMGQVKGHPLKSLDSLSDLKYPDYGMDRRYRDAGPVLHQAGRDGKYVLAGLFMLLFERMHSLYGFENVLLDLLDNEAALGRLADLIIDVHIEYVLNIHRRFGSAVHGFHMSDDWGTQRDSFIRYELWMDFFYPRYERIFSTMHEHGYDVWLHSCGRINDIIEGYIKAGVDAVNIEQPRALGIEEIGERYSGRICFESTADIQQTLPLNDPGRIRDDAEALLGHWASPQGGLIFSDYGCESDIGVKNPDLKLQMYRIFSEVSERVYGAPLPDPVL